MCKDVQVKKMKVVHAIITPLTFLNDTDNAKQNDKLPSTI